MTELFLVNMKPWDGDKWECHRCTHKLNVAADMASDLREGGHEVRVQSVLINAEGAVVLEEEAEEFKIIRCENGVGGYEIYPTHETFDTHEEAEARLAELLAT